MGYVYLTQIAATEILHPDGTLRQQTLPAQPFCAKFVVLVSTFPIRGV